MNFGIIIYDVHRVISDLVMLFAKVMTVAPHALLVHCRRGDMVRGEDVCCHREP